MSWRLALPGLAAGALGLLAGLVGYGLDTPIFGAVAGVLALAAGVAGLRVAQQLAEQGALQLLVEDELRSVRTEATKTEAELREELESAASGLSESSEYHGDAMADDPLTDPGTGLFSESFFIVALESRIAAARRHLRPVAVILVEVVADLPTGKPVAAEELLVAEAITDTLREADTACRLTTGQFALLLEDTPENGAIWTVERLRRCLNGDRSDLTVWAGIACYPSHALGTNEILGGAADALSAAREWHQDRIEVAVAAPD